MTRDAVKKVQMQVASPPEDMRDVLARIDAMLDELYILRQAVQGWQDIHIDSSLMLSDALKESPKMAVFPPREVTAATPAKKSDTPITDSLFGAAGKGDWDEVYSNAEIVHMQFGEK